MGDQAGREAAAFGGIFGQDAMEAAHQALGRMMADLAGPVLGEDTVAAQSGLVREVSRLMAGQSDLKPEPGDKRFTDPTWKDNPLFQTWMQGYLIWSKSVDALAGAMGMDELAVKRNRFFANLVTDALSPTNTMLGNPAAMKKFVETGGKSTLDGLQNFLKDMVDNGGMPAQVDKSAFDVGRNLAMSKGAVVFRNEMFELIQYAPVTEEVYETPVLFVPSMINKYYVLDLAPGRSMFEYALAQGIQVFTISWKNPSAAESEWSIDNYLEQILNACAATREITGSRQVHLAAVCAAGMMTSSVVGFLAARGDDQVRSSTTIVTGLDNSVEDTKLSIFTAPDMVDMIAGISQAQGVLDGRNLSSAFTWMRPNDLVWNYWVNNYLMGNPPPAFDILYWNSDATRMPAKTHREFLDQGLTNAFTKPGEVKVFGTPVDMGQVKCDMFVMGGLTDHICPWKNSYGGAKLYGGKVEFVLVGSGHVQSMVNPPGNPKSNYYVNSSLPASADEWLKTATKKQGSYWEHWAPWIIARSGAKRPARAPGSALFPPIAEAPGQYVMEP
ncbi:MAG TPA: class II poly(R)-hydroxyalkanoic acid synthase [Rhodoblastus sp.]|nr:class II poly(R)-hydroxyalkanoic acid synthase [Rhodoblastus sp.]